MSEVFTTLTSGLAWIGALLTLGASIAAFAKLKVTPSGLLLGFGLGGVGCANLTSKVFQLVRSAEDAGLDDYETMVGMMSCVNLVDGFFWVIAAVGLGLLPASLKKLAERDAGKPVQF